MLPKLSIANTSLIEEPVNFFSSLGGLHDADIGMFEWDPIRSEVVITVDDLYSNFFQTHEYPGKCSARLTAIGLIALTIDISFGKCPVRILNFKVTEIAPDSILSVVINFGEGQIKFECREIHGRAL